ncbi:MAG: hypothetical protein HPY54_08565 [Chthonomonadetes bacterium]|nr:hypothetical protein [Chthonomonadetes bacterium]
MTSTFTSDGFGNPVAQWGSSANPYRCAGAWGYRDDGDAGLLHVGARYYDPQVGRFISRDAVLSEHPYLYCEHEPVNSVDPGGTTPVAGALGAAAGAAAIDGPLPIGDVIGAAIVIGLVILEARGKKGKERLRDTGLQDLPDDVVRQRARDRSLPPHERDRYRREEKARQQRNKKKRAEVLFIDDGRYCQRRIEDELRTLDMVA